MHLETLKGNNKFGFIVATEQAIIKVTVSQKWLTREIVIEVVSGDKWSLFRNGNLKLVKDTLLCGFETEYGVYLPYDVISHLVDFVLKSSVSKITEVLCYE